MKNRILILLLPILFSGIITWAQYDQTKINKKAVEAYNKALEKAQNGKYTDAIESLKEAIQRDGKYIDAYLSLAGIYGEIKNRPMSISTYEKAFLLDSNYTSEYRLPYSINLAASGQFQKAYDVINSLLAHPKIGLNAKKSAEYRKRTYQFALDFEKTNQFKNYVFSPQNLGPQINTKESEYSASITIDGGRLIFTRRIGGTNEDFYGSIKQNNNWTMAQALPGDINTPLSEGAQNISQDGEWLVFTGCHRPSGMGGCDLYISYLTKNGWSEAVNLGNKINSEAWDSQPSLSPDKRSLYFTSTRPGGFGGSDIYVSHLGTNGKWSDPENLGDQINTVGDESSPFIHADNQTLYFASNTLPGYGEEDLFLVRKKGAKWGTPQNLGYPINTINRESTLFIAADAKTAYYSSDRSEGRGGIDIYTFELREDIRPAKTLWVKGKVYDQKTGAGLPSAVELIDLATKQTLSKVQTDETGNYLITLPTGKDYVFNVARRGYLFYSDNYTLTGKAPDSVYKKDIPLQPLEANAVVVLKNIFFDFAKWELKNESQIELDRLVQLLQENPTVKIQIEGHTDAIGSLADNLKLSENRAKSVVAYLSSKGIATARLTAKGFGATKAVADNKTEEGRSQNRRTELKVISK